MIEGEKNIEKIHLFPTLVMVCKNFLSNQQSEDIKNFCLLQKTKPYKNAFDGSATSTWTSKSKFIEVLEKEICTLDKLSKNIQSFIDEYSDEFNLRELSIANSWFNIQNKQSVLNRHVHELSVLSGAIFINVDDDSSELVLESPNLYSHYKSFSPIDYHSMSDIFVIKPEVGMLVLFPSWIVHSSFYQENNTENRIVISFNVELSDLKK